MKIEELEKEYQLLKQRHIELLGKYKYYIQQVANMRNEQRLFFKTRKKGGPHMLHLQNSKELEKKIDRWNNELIRNINQELADIKSPKLDI